jgi:flagellar P-ring protein precursor FlgI
VPEDGIRARNTAAVMVVARLSRHHRKGSPLDVTVSSIGDAKSLHGGTLLHTPLATADGSVYAVAQGPVSVGGFSFHGGGSDRLSQNYVLAGRVPGGGIVERELEASGTEETITIVLHDPDFTTAERVTTAINGALGEGRAQAVDAGTVTVTPPEGDESRVALLSQVEALEIEPDMAARVVMNEKTGTIVAGANVTLSACAIAHGNLSVEIRGTPYVSQPEAFSRGETAVVEDTNVTVESENTGLVPIEEVASVGDLAQALNALGVSPRDMIAVFQALKEAGALRAELRIL